MNKALLCLGVLRQIAQEWQLEVLSPLFRETWQKSAEPGTGLAKIWL